MPPPGMPPPNFSMPPPGFGSGGAPNAGGDGQELWVENKSADGKVRKRQIVCLGVAFFQFLKYSEIVIRNKFIPFRHTTTMHVQESRHGQNRRV